MRILVIEDESGVVQFIQQGLTETGYVIDVIGKLFNKDILQVTKSTDQAKLTR